MREVRMNRPEIESFPAEVARKLKTYVYRLIDPRNGETFYVGKGQGNRVFSHIRAEQNLEGDDLDNKVKRIPGDTPCGLRGRSCDSSPRNGREDCL